MHWPLVLLLIFSGVALSHLTLLHLPYFWDEGGYYIPAALDFYRTGTLIPVFTNAHPPLPNVVLGTMWHLFGFHILVTRLTACAMAAAGLTAVFVLGRRLLGTAAGVILCLLTAIYPIWFAQSSLAHADIFAAAFTLAAFTLYFTSTDFIGKNPETFSSFFRLALTSLLFCLAVLSKETAIVQPAALCAFELFLAWHARSTRPVMRAHLRWATSLAVCLPVLITWYAYHYAKTGHIFGNPTYLQYNATANFTVHHVLYALRVRFVHLFWQRKIWIPLALAAAMLLLPRRPLPGANIPEALPRRVLEAIAVLLLANLLAFAVLGGALLTRYLLPVYPLILLVCVAVWRERTRFWPWFAVLTAAAFLLALWINPDNFFAPEDNLTYRNMIVVQQDAIYYLNVHYPAATVLTAWPVAADLYRPELGYTRRRFTVFPVDNFLPTELARAAAAPGRYDTAIVFTTHYITPAFRRYLVTHPRSWRTKRYSADLDLTPQQIAAQLGGRVVWQEDHYGEWAAVLRFARSYDAALLPLAPLVLPCVTQLAQPCTVLRSTSASKPRP